jgi:diaminohydroxyphosphoribosylaminopyrimidine deaminase/5-amino-6-(5-phosphoribosylamino)uracil reductase
MRSSPERRLDHELSEARTEQAPDPFIAFREADPARPFVVAQLGQSLDGRIATISGESKYINGAPALDHLHRIRSEVDAVVVGAGTVVADDPQLTVRRVPGRSPARVVIDPTGRLRGPAKWLESDGAPCFVVTADSTAQWPAAPGSEHIRLRAENGLIPPRVIIDALFARGLRRLLIEGGARTISSFIDAGCVDRLHLLVAPIIIGSGRSGLDLHPVAELGRALRPRTTLYPLAGGEFLIDCDLRQCFERGPL